MVSLTLLLPLVTAEIKSFHSKPERRFEKYTEVFFLLRVSPLWVNSVMGLALREVWLSYVDGSYTGRFSFVIENVYIRNAIEIAWLVLSILLLWYRDKQEDLRKNVHREEGSSFDGGLSPDATDSHLGEEPSVVGGQPAAADCAWEESEEEYEGPHRDKMQRRRQLTPEWVPGSALDNEEEAEEAHEDVVVARLKKVGIENGVNDEMLGKVIDMESLDRVRNYSPTSSEDGKEKGRDKEEMANNKVSGHGRKVKKETWELFLHFRDMLQSVSNDAGNEGKTNDEYYGDGGFGEKKNTPQIKDGAVHGQKDSNRKAIDPPSDL